MCTFEVAMCKAKKAGNEELYVYSQGACEECITNCKKSNKPVCGSNGKSYKSR